MSAKQKSNDQTLFCTMVRMILGANHNAGRDLSMFGAPDDTGHIEMPLSFMAPAETGHVLGLRGNAELRQQLLEMGFTVGTPVDFLRMAPLRDPITVRVRGYQLSLRRQEAEAIWMRRCPPELMHETDNNADAESHESASLVATGSRRGR